MTNNSKKVCNIASENSVADETLQIVEDELLDGFSLRCDGPHPGLYHTSVSKKDESPIVTWIGPPLFVLGKTRDENSKSWGILLKWQDPDSVSHTWAMPDSMLFGGNSSVWLGRLADEGWSCAPGRDAQSKLTLFLNAYKTDRRARCVPCTGWYKGAFVFPDEVLLPQDMQDGERIVLQAQTPHNPSEGVYMIANGTGKTRCHRSGDAKDTKSWHCMLFSTGEKSVTERMAEENIPMHAGQEVRLIDIPSDAGAGYGMFEDLHGYTTVEAFAASINQAAATNYGHMDTLLELLFILFWKIGKKRKKLCSGKL